MSIEADPSNSGSLGCACQLSETRSSGGLLLARGLMILAAAIVSSLEQAGLSLSAMVYLAYGVSRVNSFEMDGPPSEVLMQAATLEWIVGLLSLFFLLRRRVTDLPDSNSN